MSEDSVKNVRIRFLLTLLCLTSLVIWIDPFPTTAAGSAVSLATGGTRNDVHGVAPLQMGENVSGVVEASPRQAPPPVADAFRAKLGDWLPKPPTPTTAPKKVPAPVAATVLVPTVVAPLAPPPPQPPALKVIGTWSGLEQPGIFLSGPNGTLFVKQGDKLLSDFEVKSIEPRELVLLQISIQHEWRLPLPVITP